MTSYTFDEVHLLEKASLRVKAGVTATLTIRKLVSDGTGLLHAHSGHTHNVEYEEWEWAALTTRTNFIVDNGGDLQVRPARQQELDGVKEMCGQSRKK